jgi:hypothetical protein
MRRQQQGVRAITSPYGVPLEPGNIVIMPNRQSRQESDILRSRPELGLSRR